jgi:outer membrane protein TolC
MQVLKPLTLLCLLYSSLVLANENTKELNTYISEYKIEQFKYEYEKNEAEAAKLRDSWIAPLQINYSYSKSNPYGQEQTRTNAALKMDQPIFKSGGIYYGIKFAAASRLYTQYSVDVAKRKMIKDTITILMQIKQTALKIEVQKLQIKNSEINLEQKKEQYLSGQLDSGFLDDAIIQRNSVIQALYDVQTEKEKLITQFRTLSDASYETIELPQLEMIDSEEFMSNNLLLKQGEAELQKNRYSKNITIAKYLPSVNFTAGYNYTKSEGQLFSTMNVERDSYDYGIRANLPIDLNTFRDVESSKIDFLKSKVAIKDKTRELSALFEQVMHNIDNYDKKIALSNETIKIYSRLLSDTKDLYEIGHKTQYDVETLNNSLKIQDYDTKIYELNKQIVLLSLYEMYVNKD